MPLRKYLSLGKRWVLERCNLLLKAVFSRLPIQNRVFFYSIRADGKLLENSQCVYDALGNVKRWWWPGCFPTRCCSSRKFIIIF